MNKISKLREGQSKKKKNAKKMRFSFVIQGLFLFLICLAVISIVSSAKIFSIKYDSGATNVKADTENQITLAVPVIPPLDIAAYDAKIIEIANYPISHATTTATSTPHLWPPKTVYPNGGALLPFNRIVAYYGNFYSTSMGVLGQYPVPEMLAKLNGEVEKWQAADPSTPVIPALDYIAVTAQGSPGDDGKYRLRMPADQIEKAIQIADQIHGIVFLDVQVGQSTLQAELPPLEQYLKLPEVHLAIDPEFSMKTGKRPGTIIGTMDATDINYAANFLADIVKANNLTPKILVVHRFTEDMVTNYKQITPLPQVEIVMDMDGWSTPAKKIKIYNDVIFPEPVQFTGIKLFYKNDLLPPSTGLLTPAQILNLRPQPLYIQYQ